MSRTVEHVLALQESIRGLERMLECLTHQIDTKQWAAAGNTLGLFEEKGRAISSVARLSQHAVADAEWAAKQNS